MDEKLDQIIEYLHEVRLEQALASQRLDTYNSYLDEHMRRSDALEKKVEELYKFKYYVVGALSIITALLTLGMDLVKEYILK